MNFLVSIWRAKISTNLFGICKFVFVLPHGQRNIERGFNINKEILIDNLQEMALLSQHMVYDHMHASGKEPHDFDIERGRLLSCRGSHARYMEDLEQYKKNDAENIHGNKRKLLSDELTEVKKHKSDEKASICDLQKSIDN